MLTSGGEGGSKPQQKLVSSPRSEKLGEKIEEYREYIWVWKTFVFF